MTKSEALSYFDGSIRKCAAALNLSTQAVYDWPDDEIPLLRQYQIRERASSSPPTSNSRDARKRRARPARARAAGAAE